jgi:hypothetical protein
MFSRFAVAPKKLPRATNFWSRRSTFPIRTFGNTEHNDCTRAKQAIASMRMERIETTRTPRITDQEVIRVYQDMSERLYGNDAHRHVAAGVVGRALDVGARLR